MPNDIFREFGPFVPYQSPVAPPVTGVFDAPQFGICINEAYVPYVLGALKVFLKDATWDTDDPNELARVKSEFNKLMSSWSLCSREDDLPTGSITLFAGVTVPDGWLACDGSAISRTLYAPLFAVLGTLYGDGDGHDTFNLPDFMGRAPVGVGAGFGLTPRALADSFGVEAVSLEAQHNGTHVHKERASGLSGYGDREIDVIDTAGGTNAAIVLPIGTVGASFRALETSQSGAGAAHPNIQPSLAMHFIIRTGL